LSVLNGNVINSGNYVGPNVLTSANNQINIMSPPYNAQCNVNVEANGSMTAGSNVLVGSGFTAAMVGRKAIVWGAGANNGNGNFGPLVTTVQSFQSSTHITLATPAISSIPNTTSNTGGNYEIGTDDSAAIQSAYNAASALGFSVLVPANGHGCFTGAIDLSAGKTSHFITPIEGQGTSITTLIGLPGQDVFQWPDLFISDSLYAYIKGITVAVDNSIDVSCHTQTPTSCPSVGNGQTTFGRVAGLNGAVTTTGAGAIVNGAVCSGGTCTISLSNVMAGTIQSGMPAKFSGFTGSMTALNGQTLTVLSSPTPSKNSFAVSTTSISGTLTDTGTFSGSTAQNPPIAPGPAWFINAVIAASSDSTFDLLEVRPGSGGPFSSNPPWFWVGQQISIPSLSFSTTVNSVVTTGCPSGFQCLLMNNAFGSAQTGLTGNVGSGLAPPWYVGNCGFSLPSSDGALTSGVQMVFDDLHFVPANPSQPQFSNSSCGMFFQGVPYRTTFHRVTTQLLPIGYVEAISVVDNLVTWTPDTWSFHDVDFNTQISFVGIAGNQRVIDGMHVYGSGNIFQLGPMFLPGPENLQGDSSITQLYQEPWGFNSGENSRYTGNNWSIVGSSLLQGGASVGGPYIEWLANASVVSATQIGGTNAPTPSTAGLQIAGSGNLFNNIELEAISPQSQFVNDTGIGNIVLANGGNVSQSPRYINATRCPTGQIDFSFLNGFTTTPFAGWCSLTVDFSTSTFGGSGANFVSYVPSTPGDGNPDPGYIFSPSTATGGVMITPVGVPSAVGAGYRFPASPSINLVVGMKTSTPGTMTFTVHDETANTTVHTCTYTVSAANAFAIHGQLGSADACNFSLAGVPAGDILQYDYSLGILGNESIGFISVVPNSTSPAILANGSTATTQTSTDNSTLVATDAFVQSVAASGFTLPFWQSGSIAGTVALAPSANVVLFDFNIGGGTGTWSNIAYQPTTADNTADLYDLAIYSLAATTPGSTGTLICHLGATPGTTFAPNTTAGKTLGFLSSCPAISGNNTYLIAYCTATANIASAALASSSLAHGIHGNAATGVSSGGNCPSTITIGTTTWSGPTSGNQAPWFVLHN
jgi:hypothetical protein